MATRSPRDRRTTFRGLYELEVCLPPVLSTESAPQARNLEYRLRLNFLCRRRCLSRVELCIGSK